MIPVTLVAELVYAHTELAVTRLYLRQALPAPIRETLISPSGTMLHTWAQVRAATRGWRRWRRATTRMAPRPLVNSWVGTRRRRVRTDDTPIVPFFQL